MKTFQEIPFAHFFTETKALLNERDFKAIDPYAWHFYKFGSHYLSFTINQGTLFINLVAGTGKNEWIHNLIENNQIYQIDTVSYYISPNNHRIKQNEDGTQTDPIAKYFGFVLKKRTPNYYSDGSDGLLFQLDVSKCPRIKKPKETK